MLLRDLFDDLRQIQERVDTLDTLIEKEVKNGPVARSLHELRGIGLLCASALSCAIGDAKNIVKEGVLLLLLVYRRGNTVPAANLLYLASVSEAMVT